MKRIGFIIANVIIGMIMGAMIQSHNNGEISLWWLILTLISLLSLNSNKQ